MKLLNRITISAITLISAVSCNLTYYPDTAINTEDAMESVADCKAFRTGLYSGMKYIFTGAYVYAPELQTDLYHAVRNFGNFSGDWYTYSVTANASEANSVWFGVYSYIANANFLISGTQKLLASGTLSADDTKTVEQYYGEACYIRAHMYYLLTLYFCKDYEPETAATEYGVPVVTEYAPTFDSKKYPSRGTLAATYEQISADLAEAAKYVTAAGSVGSAYVTEDVVKALAARVALTTHDYDTALLNAKSLIDGGKYELETSADKYASAWVNDDLKETIWQAAMTGQDDTGNSMSYFIYNTSGKKGADNPQYIPEKWVLDLYDKANDIRYGAYFDTRSVVSPVTGTMTLLVKYPGNPKLYSSVTNYCNKPKIFRISEMYLIAAEAAAQKGGQDNVASYYLNQLRSKRIQGWSTVNYTGVTLMSEIRDERVRELFGEGCRLWDLKRWHIGFTRDSGQDASLVQPGYNFTKSADDPEFLWPIPTAEIQANSKIEHEQNEAYK